jgi:hypothetical protein
MRLTEKAFMQQVRELARLFGWLEFHPHDSRRSTPGYPDLFMVRPPRVLFAELKSDTGRVTPAQRAWLGALEQCPGVEVYLWRPGDWDAIVERLQRGNGRD